MSIGQYIKDTQGELRHVAWPTRTQTVVYTILVSVLSIVVALYLGLFDYLFTTSLARLVSVMPTSQSEQPLQTTTLDGTTIQISTSTAE